MVPSPTFSLLLLLITRLWVSSTASAHSSARPLYTAVDPYDWFDQCVPPFRESNFAALIDHSNFELIDEPAGLCADFLACAFERCVLPPEGIAALNSTTTDDVLEDPDLPPFNLPAYIAFPQTARDVVDLIKIADDNCWTVSIKNGGHSHHGASTMKGSLQLNLRSLQGYANTTAGVVPCSTTDETGPAARACQRAMANGKTAVIQVGGGEVWDYVYRAVDVWNDEHDEKYDIVGGGAGSVSAIGGWMQGGGLSIGDERMYGMGVDQVMELQMVLANGMHIKFGPTEWVDDPVALYPLTTKVEGLCNWNVVDDEAAWDWKECPEELNIPFAKLWKAVRGGGGGTYGMVVSAYYQLHPYKPLYRVFPDLQVAPLFLGTCAATPGCFELASPVITLFFINLLFDPEAIGLDVETSNSCGSPTFALDLSWALQGVNSQLFCRNPEPVVAAWQSYLRNATELQILGDDLLTLGLGSVSATNLGSYAKAGSSHDGSRAPLGRVADEHPPATNYITENCWSILLPIDFLLLRTPDALSLLRAIIPAHVIGGNAAISGDSMNAVPLAERRAGFQGYLCPDLVGAEVEPIVWSTWKFFDPPDLEDGEFFGGSEYNHIDNVWYGPLKADFVTSCPSDFTLEEKQEQCVDVLETVWGTKLLKELEDIKLEVDPRNMFRCYRCVGERNPRVCANGASKCQRRKLRGDIVQRTQH